MINYEDGLIRDDSGAILGNVMNGVVRDGDSKGAGNPLGNAVKGIVRDGDAKGAGNPLFNVKAGMVRNGKALGSGISIGRLFEFSIKGMEGHPED